MLSHLPEGRGLLFGRLLPVLSQGGELCGRLLFGGLHHHPGYSPITHFFAYFAEPSLDQFGLIWLIRDPFLDNFGIIKDNVLSDLFWASLGHWAIFGQFQCFMSTLQVSDLAWMPATAILFTFTLYFFAQSCVIQHNLEKKLLHDFPAPPPLFMCMCASFNPPLPHL